MSHDFCIRLSVVVVVVPIPEAGNVPGLLEQKVSPKFFKTGMGTSIFFLGVRAYVSLRAYAPARMRICVCASQTEPGVWSWMLGALSESKCLHRKSFPVTYLPEMATFPIKIHSALIHVLMPSINSYLPGT